MNAKEKWISETEKSLDGMAPIEPNPYLYSKLLNRLNTKAKTAPARLVWAGAASFIILILLNIFVLRSGSTNERTNSSDLRSAAKQFQLMNDNSIDYN